jgi:hypothetical protein
LRRLYDQMPPQQIKDGADNNAHRKLNSPPTKGALP